LVGHAKPESIMLRWAIIFLVISLVAGGLGFTGLAAGAGRIAKILFGLFFALFVLVILLAVLVGDLLSTTPGP
jgi:uncharacterized membrane protein YtjA (UPF0391 family)